MSNITRYTNIYAFGEDKDIEEIRKEQTDKPYEIGLASVANAEIAEGSEPLKISFFCYHTKGTSIGEEFLEFVQKYPKIVFVGVGEYDCTESYEEVGMEWFFAKGGKVVAEGRGCANWNDFDGAEDAYEQNMNIALKWWTEWLVDWMDENDVIKKLGKIAKKKDFWGGFINILKENSGGHNIYWPEMEWIPKEFWLDKKYKALLIERILDDGIDSLENFPEEIRTEEFCLEMAKKDGAVLEYVPENLKTEELCLEAIKTGDGWGDRKGLLEFVPKALKAKMKKAIKEIEAQEHV